MAIAIAKAFVEKIVYHLPKTGELLDRLDCDCAFSSGLAFLMSGSDIGI